jgi:hypothetical protein
MINAYAEIRVEKYEKRLAEPEEKEEATCACGETIQLSDGKIDNNWPLHIRRKCPVFAKLSAPFIKLDLEFFGQDTLPDVYAVEFDLELPDIIEFRDESTGVLYIIIYIPDLIDEHFLSTLENFIREMGVYTGEIEKRIGCTLLETFLKRTNEHENSGLLDQSKMWILPLLEGPSEQIRFLEGLFIEGGKTIYFSILI